MTDDDTTLSMPVPLDSDGFLRRECPTCEREFKWLAATGDDEAQSVPDGGYFCPYCAIQASPEAWFTQAQIEVAHNMIATEVVGPMIDDLGRGLRDVGRRSGGLVTASMRYDAPEPLDPLTEEDDMRRVDFACHPGEPAKVLDAWARLVHCLLCGETA